MAKGWRQALAAVVILAGRSAVAGDGPGVGSGRALIVVGLPGDDDHESLFRETATAWRDWLTGPLKFPEGGVRVVFGKVGLEALGAGPATRGAIGSAVAALKEGLRPGDRFWVLVLGHANEDGGHGFLHLPGPDLRDDEFAALFADVPCREQVFWLTTAASGWFVPALAKTGRVVIAATERDKEFNETEFPQALVDVGRLARAELDRDRDGKVSVWELFVRVVEAVEARYAEDERAPTEHAQLDDDGDGRGSEPPAPDRGDPKDGAVAKQTFLPAVEDQ